MITFTDELRVYVHEYGPVAALAIIAAICEETRDANKGQAAGPIAIVSSHNADVIRQAMTRMV